jgi:hypothetical protein
MQKLNERQITLLKHTFIDFQQTSEFLKIPLVADKADIDFMCELIEKSLSDALAMVR